MLAHKRSPAFVVSLVGAAGMGDPKTSQWYGSAGHAHAQINLQQLSPKAIPSVFTYQDDDSDIDVAIQFFEKDSQDAAE